jgi:hypothetical protein
LPGIGNILHGCANASLITKSIHYKEGSALDPCKPFAEKRLYNVKHATQPCSLAQSWRGRIRQAHAALVGKFRVQRTRPVAVQPYSMQVRLHLLPAQARGLRLASPYWRFHCVEGTSHTSKPHRSDPRSFTRRMVAHRINLPSAGRIHVVVRSFLSRRALLRWVAPGPLLSRLTSQ